MRRCLLSALILVGASSGSEASCVDPSTLVRSTVSITREFSEHERRAAPGVLGIRGTGWFLSPRQVVTAGHVADAMRLSTEDWKEIEVRERESKMSVPARILRIAGSAAEKIAVIEIRGSLPDTVALRVRTGPLVPEERLLSVAYPNGQLRFASGRFAEYGSTGTLSGTALLEMHDGSNRLVLDHGASGAPVLDCEGRVVAVVSTLITQTLALPTGPVRVSTAWQVPNVLSIPAEVLNGGFSAE
jgi:trypsin-like peptidase